MRTLKCLQPCKLVFFGFSSNSSADRPAPNVNDPNLLDVKTTLPARTAFALQHVSFFGNELRSAMIGLQLRRRYALVDLALKLNVLAVFAVFLFIAAILLGAF